MLVSLCHWPCNTGKMGSLKEWNMVGMDAIYGQKAQELPLTWMDLAIAIAEGPV